MMMMMILPWIVTAAFLLAATNAFGIDNFRFDSPNVMYTNKLPYTVMMHLTYHLDIDTSPNLHFLPVDLLRHKDFNVATLTGSTDAPWMCSGTPEQMIAYMNRNAHDKINDNLNALIALEKSIHANESIPQGFKDRVQKKLQPLLDVTNPEFKCESLKSKLIPFSDGVAFKTELTFTFEAFKPLIFIDYFGVGSFSLKQKVIASSPEKKAGASLRFCDGVSYSGDLYTMEPRPVCPDNVPEEHQNFTYGYITVYKPNVVTVRRQIIMCEMWTVFIHTYKDLLGADADPWPLQQVVQVTVEECREWYKTRNCNFDEIAMRDGDDLDELGCYPPSKDNSIFDVFKNKNCTYYRDHPEEETLSPMAGGFNEVNAGTINGTFNKLATTPNLGYIFHKGRITTYVKRRAQLSIGVMDILMPSLQMITPWLTIPTENLLGDSFYSFGKTFFWEPFNPSDLCLFTPRFAGYVDVITYHTGDAQMQNDPNIDATYMKYFISSTSQAMYVVDDTQRITEMNPLYCIASTNNTELYLTANNEIIRFTTTRNKIDPVYGYSDREYANGAFDKIYVDPKHDVIAVKSYAATVNDVKKGDKSIITIARRTSKNTMVGSGNYKIEVANQKECDDNFKKYGVTTCATVIQQNTSFVTVAANNIAEPQLVDLSKIGKNISDMVTIADVRNYIQWTNVLNENRNLHARALMNCKNNQINWDNFRQSLPIDPSMAISARTNLAIQAKFAGNGFYNVKYCELISNLDIIPHLFTNYSETNITLGKKEYMFSDIMKGLKVLPDYKKCLAMPLIIFRFPESDIELIGQMAPNGIVNTNRIQYLEECTYAAKHIFTINDVIYIFSNYEFKQKLPSSIVHNKTMLTDKSPEDEPTVDGNIITKESRDLLHAIKFIPVTTQNVETTIGDSFGWTMVPRSPYTLQETMSATMALVDVVQQTIIDRFAQSVYDKQLQMTSHQTTNLGDLGFGNWNGGGGIISSVFGGFGQLIKSGGDAAATVITAAGGAGSSLIGAAGSAVSSTLTAIIAPIACVIAIPILAVVVYMLCGRKKKKDIVKSDPAYGEEPPPYSEDDPNGSDSNKSEDDDGGAASEDDDYEVDTSKSSLLDEKKLVNHGHRKIEYRR